VERYIDMVPTSQDTVSTYELSKYLHVKNLEELSMDIAEKQPSMKIMKKWTDDQKKLENQQARTNKKLRNQDVLILDSSNMSKVQKKKVTKTAALKARILQEYDERLVQHSE
jgi:hypothetical protein